MVHAVELGGSNHKRVRGVSAVASRACTTANGSGFRLFRSMSIYLVDLHLCDMRYGSGQRPASGVYSFSAIQL